MKASKAQLQATRRWQKKNKNRVSIYHCRYYLKKFLREASVEQLTAFMRSIRYEIIKRKSNNLG